MRRDNLSKNKDFKKFNLSIKSLSARKIPLMIISISIVVIVIFAVYAWWSLAYWENLDKSHVKLRQEVISNTSRVIDSPVNNSDDKLAKFEALEKINSLIVSNSNICDVSTLIKWQSDLFDNKSIINRCTESSLAVNRLGNSIVILTNFLKDEKKLSDLIIFTDNKYSLESYQDYLQFEYDRWKNLQESLKTLEVNSEFQVILSRAIIESEKITNNWSKLISADKAKDSKSYDKYRDELSISYGSFKSIIELDNEIFNDIKDKLQKEINNLSE